MSVAGLRVQHCVDGPSSSQAGGTGQEAAKFGSASPWMSTNPTGPSMQIPVPSSAGGKDPPKITESHGKHGKQPGDAILATQKSFNKLQSMHLSTAILDAPSNPMAFEREANEREANEREATKRERQGCGNGWADAWQRQ